MATINQPKYLSFDHLYVETVTVTDATRLSNGVAAHRFVNRKGAYPIAGEYAAGVSLFDIYGPGVLTGYERLSLSGTVEITATTGAVSGTNTAFETELTTGALIEVAGVQYRVVSIASDTSLVVERVDGAAVTAVGAGAAAVRLEAKGGYGVDDPAGLSLEYESRFNSSTTPYAPRVFPYQKNLSVVTNGIAIVEVAPGENISVDTAIYSDVNGRATTTAGAGVLLGRSLDDLSTGPSDVGFIRVKLGAGTN